MYVSEIPWEDLIVGQVVFVASKTDTMRGVVAKLDEKPMIWIAWNDGNRQEYHQSVLHTVELVDEQEYVPNFNPNLVLFVRDIVDPEGE
jgi:hypothetical protein